jgi:ribosomal protein S18 acetylase RimI-like enzyme
VSTADAQIALDDVVSVHTAAFPGFFMTQLGPAFLREYYRCVVSYPRGILLTEPGGEGCNGFVTGFVNPAAFYRHLKQHRIRLAAATLRGLISRPSRAAVLLTNYRRAGDAADRADEPDTAELSSLAVRPSVARSGLGSSLVRRFVDAAALAGATRVTLTTDADGNDAVNRFYRNLGFSLLRTFEARPGRILNEYAIATKD